jgi:glycerol uptake facilitator-like aquaporin
MSRPSLQVLVAEALGTALLLAAVVGSGIMAVQLSGGNDGIALLANTIATGAALVVLIEVFGPISGAHFNPAVTLALALRRRLPWQTVAPYWAVQCLGGVLGVWLAHALFDLPVWQVSTKIRSSPGQWLSEAVATFTLLTVIFAALRTKTEARLPYSVALTVVAAYWFTASTSFANPAVTLARALTESFAGIRPLDAPGFMFGQAVGMGLAVLLDKSLTQPATPEPAPLPE